MRFDIKAIQKGAGGIATLSLEAASEADASGQAQALGYTVLTIHPRLSSVLRGGGLQGRLPLGGVRFQLQLFTQELLALLEAGLPLVEAIQTLAEKEQRPDSRKILERILQALFEGQTLSAALQCQPAVFPPLYVATVRASERTGDLDKALGRYLAYQAQMEQVRKKIVSASIYPVLLIAVGGLVTIFLLGYVVPRFSAVYEGLGDDLPFFSSLLLAWGRFLQVNAPLVAAAAAGLLAALGWGATRPGTWQAIGTRLWRLPAIGERMRIYQLARFYRTLGMLQSSGIPIVVALDMVSGLLQPTLREQLRLAARDIREGQSISQAMEQHGLTTSVAVRMLRVGENTGRMGAMMERIATFYEDEMARWVEWFTRLFEPLLMAFIGLVIGAIVILMYLPIFELAGSID
ncbi:type II secretion system F family protein [Thauera aromatica]|nr:type II secretion system F family protein [Thauera aromatica]MCK2125445.1 type II secretion system F family protein [Thauera aromatica]